MKSFSGAVRTWCLTQVQHVITLTWVSLTRASSIECSQYFCNQGDGRGKLRSFTNSLKISMMTTIMIHFRRNLIAQQSFKKSLLNAGSAPTWEQTTIFHLPKPKHRPRARAPSWTNTVCQCPNESKSNKLAAPSNYLAEYAGAAAPDKTHTGWARLILDKWHHPAAASSSCTTVTAHLGAKHIPTRQWSHQLVAKSLILG